MGEAVVADFVGRFHTADMKRTEPVTGRVLLSRKRLVLAHDGGKTTIPLSSVSDINVGTVPAKLSEFFSDTITLAYSIDDGRNVAVIESGGDNVGRFKTVLFKTLLGGHKVKVKHPAKVGGRVTDASTKTAKLKLSKGSLRIVTRDGSVTIDLSTVTNFRRGQYDIAGKKRPTIEVTHMHNGTAKTTFISLPNNRKLNLLGRYLQLEYKDVMEEIAEIEVSPEQTEVLVSLYSAGGQAELGEIVTGDVATVQLVLETLRKNALISENGSALSLTAKGRVVATEQIEDVNM
ncbi:hypothetical protein HUB97_02495 [Halorubraceae archaeon YAN]|nr:hypothetical protein [Halorubraceae archaeon YAN]